RGNGSNRQSVGSSVLLPLPAQNDLEMRNLAISDRPARSVKTEISNMVLPARIEAAADLNVQLLHSFIQDKEFLCQAMPNLGAKTSGGCNSEFARICTGARRNIHNRSCSHLSQTDALQCSIELGQIGFTNPTQNDVLFHCRADILSA